MHVWRAIQIPRVDGEGVTDLIIADEDAPEVSSRRLVQRSRRLDPGSLSTLPCNRTNLMMTPRTRTARTASTGPKVSRTIAKAARIRQDEHLNGPVIFPAEAERLILSGCGGDDSRELFPEQLPNSDAAFHRDVKKGVAHASIGIAVRRFVVLVFSIRARWIFFAYGNLHKLGVAYHCIVCPRCGQQEVIATKPPTRPT